jgi:hypothetical protein
VGDLCLTDGRAQKRHALVNLRQADAATHRSFMVQAAGASADRTDMLVARLMKSMKTR